MLKKLAIRRAKLHFTYEADEHGLLGRVIGEPLWPEYFGLAALAHIRANTFARDWSALYQQQPTDAAGAAGKFGLTDRQRRM